MTEREYINACELKTVTAAINVLRDICVGNSKVIKEKEYTLVINKLFTWQERLFKTIDINEIEE